MVGDSISHSPFGLVEICIKLEIKDNFKLLFFLNYELLVNELLETLANIALTKEEEIKLKNYDDDLWRLGSAERFLKPVLDIPLAFKRIEVK